MASKRTLFMLRQAPYRTSPTTEAIESILVAGVFEQDVSVLFKDDGVWQLVKDQDGTRLGTRTVGNVLGALPEYGVTKLFVCEQSLQRRALTLNDLVLSVQPLTRPQQQALITNQDAVLND